MTGPQIYFKRQGERAPISIEELRRRCINYTRNVMFGLNTQLTLDQLKRWLDADVCLLDYPPDSFLQSWLDSWTPEFLARWSYENDHINQRSSN